MLAKIAPCTNDFRGLARYLVQGKSGKPDPKRVAWSFTQNLPTDDPELAALYMAATAELSTRVRKAAYHLMIGWHARENPSPEVMKEIAQATLELAGLAEHEALVMGHGDKPNPHLHILVNRIHPETGRAWKTNHDFVRFEKIMRKLAEDHRFRYVPSHAFNREQTEALPMKPDTPATYAAKRGAATSRPQWSRTSARMFGEELSEWLAPDATCEDLEDALAEHGLRLEPKGKGFVVGDDISYTKLSRLELTADVEARLLARTVLLSASRLKDPAQLELVDGIDILRALASWGLADREDVTEAIKEEVARREDVRARRPSLSGQALTRRKPPSPWRHPLER
ncbi:MAG: relaxase/mobilization nuclease domain-containing protein [Proteobacteria bacterium]|nr:relaxase/mobilization nuclease domain-containing protein [Pseudomonadota bacterium]